MEVDIEERKKFVIADLKKLEAECYMLLARIPVYINEISNITTLEEAKEFDKKLNKINAGLEIIAL